MLGADDQNFKDDRAMMNFLLPAACMARVICLGSAKIGTFRKIDTVIARSMDKRKLWWRLY